VFPDSTGWRLLYPHDAAAMVDLTSLEWQRHGYLNGQPRGVVDALDLTNAIHPGGGEVAHCIRFQAR
jgi:hypothetical protein